MPIPRTLWLVALPLATLLCGQTAEPTLSERSRDILDQAVNDKNPDTRKEAAIALSLAAAGEPFASWLQTMLDDKDVEVRLATVASLVDLHGSRTIEALHKALKDEVPEVSFAAAKALFVLNDPEGKRVLLDVVGGETKTASGFFTKQKRDAMRMMHTPRPMFLFALKTGVAFVPVPGVGAGVASMQGLLSDPSTSGRAAATLLLAREKDTETMAALREALSDKDWSVRAAAVHSLAVRDDPALEEDISKLLDDKKEQVRLRAAAACSRLEMIRLNPPKKTIRKRSKRTAQGAR